MYIIMTVQVNGASITFAAFASSGLGVEEEEKDAEKSLYYEHQLASTQDTATWYNARAREECIQTTLASTSLSFLVFTDILLQIPSLLLQFP